MPACGRTANLSELFWDERYISTVICWLARDTQNFIVKFPLAGIWGRVMKLKLLNVLNIPSFHTKL